MNDVDAGTTIRTGVLEPGLRKCIEFFGFKTLWPGFLCLLPQIVIRVFPATVRADFAVKNVSFGA